MGEIVRFDDASPQYAAVRAINGTRRERVQSGTATLVAGTVTVTGVVLTAYSKIHLTRNTPGGAVGDLSAPAASRNTGTGQFVINSASGTDTSTVDWRIENSWPHADVTAVSVSGDPKRSATIITAALTAANGADLPTCLTLAGQIAVLYPLHLNDATSHVVADATDTLANAAPVDLPSLITFLNDAKAKFNAHIPLRTYHYNVDSANTVAATNASDLPTSITLINAIKTAFNAHIAAAPAGNSVNLVSA